MTMPITTLDCEQLEEILFGNPATLTAADIPRLQTQLDAVRSIAADGQWWTLDALAAAVQERTGRHATPQSISARLRDLRKAKFGGHQVARRSLGNGLFEYRVVRPGEARGGPSLIDSKDAEQDDDGTLPSPYPLSK